MKRGNDDRIIDLLTPKNRPEPPPDLPAKLRDEVPASVPAGSLAKTRNGLRRFLLYGSGAAIAASLLLATTLVGRGKEAPLPTARFASGSISSLELPPSPLAVTPTALPTNVAPMASPAPAAAPRADVYNWRARDDEAARVASLGYISNDGISVERGQETRFPIHGRTAGAAPNAFVDPERDRFSTFALDVDTGSYTLVRRYLGQGQLPPPALVRPEELVNAFDYGDRAPSSEDFALHADGAPNPFAQGTHLVRFNIKARNVEAVERKPAVLTFVIDISGSMQGPQKLGLVKQALTLLLAELRRDDRVGLVVFGDNGRVLAEPTSDKDAIAAAIDGLKAEGSTNAEEGLALGYRIADRFYESRAINRVILCSDGVANVGRTGPAGILARIKAEAGKGIELSTVGFGMGEYNDKLMEQLADQGDGVYAYVDNLQEAKRIFVDNLTGTLETIATDAKAQVEWNPSLVTRYRLIGYENRDVADRQFRDDEVDGGEIGAGHSVTAIYEIELARDASGSDPLAVLRLRYKGKASGRVVEEELPVQVRDLAGSWPEAPRSLRLASIVAQFGEILRGSAPVSSMDELARRATILADDRGGDPKVTELLVMIRQAASLVPAS